MWQKGRNQVPAFLLYGTGGGFGGALVEPWWSLGGALVEPWWSLGVALGWLCTPESMPSIGLWGGFGVALGGFVPGVGTGFPSCFLRSENSDSFTYCPFAPGKPGCPLEGRGRMASGPETHALAISNLWLVFRPPSSTPTEASRQHEEILRSARPEATATEKRDNTSSAQGGSGRSRDRGYLSAESSSQRAKCSYPLTIRLDTCGQRRL